MTRGEAIAASPIVLADPCIPGAGARQPERAGGDEQGEADKQSREQGAKHHEGHLLKLDSKTRIDTQDGDGEVLSAICAGVAVTHGTSTPQPICFRAAIQHDEEPRSAQTKHTPVVQPFITVQVGQHAGRGVVDEERGGGGIPGRRRGEVDAYLARVARDLEDILQDGEGEHLDASITDTGPQEGCLPMGSEVHRPTPAVRSGRGRISGGGLENTRLSGTVFGEH